MSDIDSVITVHVKPPRAEGVGHYVPRVPLPLLIGTSSSVRRNTSNTYMAQLMTSSYTLAYTLVYVPAQHTKPF